MSTPPSIKFNHFVIVDWCHRYAKVIIIRYLFVLLSCQYNIWMKILQDYQLVPGTCFSVIFLAPKFQYFLSIFVDFAFVPCTCFYVNLYNAWVSLESRRACHTQTALADRFIIILRWHCQVQPTTKTKLLFPQLTAHAWDLKLPWLKYVLHHLLRQLPCLVIIGFDRMSRNYQLHHLLLGRMHWNKVVLNVHDVIEENVFWHLGKIILAVMPKLMVTTSQWTMILGKVIRFNWEELWV